MSTDLETRLRSHLQTIAATAVIPPVPTVLSTETAAGRIGAVSPPAPAARQQRSRRRRRLLWGLLSVPGVAALAVLTATTVFVEVTGPSTPAQAAAVAQLRAAARVAATRPAVTTQPGQYLHLTLDTVQTPTINDLGELSVQTRTEVWIPAGSSGDVRALRQETLDPVTYLHPGDAAKFARDPAATFPVGRQPPQWTTWSAGGNDFNNPSASFLAHLPTQALILGPMIAAAEVGHGQGLRSEMLVTVADMLRYSVAPPKLRAALFEVASHIPGVTLIPGAVALDGRSGIAVALDHNGYRQEVVFDPTTADLIGTSEVNLIPDADYPAGAVIDSEARTTDIVDQLPPH